MREGTPEKTTEIQRLIEYSVTNGLGCKEGVNESIKSRGIGAVDVYNSLTRLEICSLRGDAYLTTAEVIEDSTRRWRLGLLYNKLMEEYQDQGAKVTVPDSIGPEDSVIGLCNIKSAMICLGAAALTLAGQEGKLGSSAIKTGEDIERISGPFWVAALSEIKKGRFGEFPKGIEIRIHTGLVAELLSTISGLGRT